MEEKSFEAIEKLAVQWPFFLCLLEVFQIPMASVFIMKMWQDLKKQSQICMKNE